MKHGLIVAASAALMLAGFTATEAVAAPEAKCKACHTFEKGGKNKVGPNLFGVVGRKAGTHEGFRYSKSVQGWTWDEAHLKEWVCNSQDAVKKFSGDDNARTKMPPMRKCGKDADAVVAYLKTLK